ncbi:hypothetical protein APE01nite_00380 [Acetobacter peroxydans]|uniref:Uncharacterized protein n=1 Tax=Acetobacter peroxydans TaxID=104098 RepID=A0A4Y3TMK3_9PROT|nr:hypothetical protein AA0475_1010 [Acetobacter peroxydans]GEB84241.1 hypothetical protein APE01nite_00380 [Acetobacter peroxydans]
MLYQTKLAAIRKIASTPRMPSLTGARCESTTYARNWITNGFPKKYRSIETKPADMERTAVTPDNNKFKPQPGLYIFHRVNIIAMQYIELKCPLRAKEWIIL